MTTDDPSTVLRIYLFDRTGQLYWQNGKMQSSEDKGILQTSLFATLYVYAIEALNEELRDLMLNELRISIFTIYKKYLVAIVTQRYIEFDLRKIDSLKLRVLDHFKKSNVKNSDEKILQLLINDLTEFQDKMLHWLEDYTNESNQIINTLMQSIHLIEELGVGIFIYSWNNMNRIFKYIPSGVDIDMRIEDIIATILLTKDKIVEFDHSIMLINNTVININIDDVILVVVLPIEKYNHPIDETIAKIISTSNTILQIIKFEAN